MSSTPSNDDAAKKTEKRSVVWNFLVLGKSRRRVEPVVVDVGNDGMKQQRQHMPNVVIKPTTIIDAFLALAGSKSANQE
jgi:hypothetical protein